MHICKPSFLYYEYHQSFFLCSPVPACLQDLASLCAGPQYSLSLPCSFLQPRYGTQGERLSHWGTLPCLWLLGSLWYLSRFSLLLGKGDGWDRCLLHPPGEEADLLAASLVGVGEEVPGDLYQEGTSSFSMLTCTLLWYLFIIKSIKSKVLRLDIIISVYAAPLQVQMTQTGCIQLLEGVSSDRRTSLPTYIIH